MTAEYDPGWSAAARHNLLAAVAGLDLSAEQMATVEWMSGLELQTVVNVTEVIWKARKAGES